MANRGWGFIIFVIFVLVVIIGLQVGLYRKNARVIDSMGEFVEILSEIPSQVGEAVSEGGDDSGDWLVWAFAVEPRTLNPVSVERDIYSLWMCVKNIYEPLLIYDLDTVEMKPLLADWFKVSDDGLEYTFHIRDEAKFSDGVDVSADDVIFTYETIVNPEVDAADLANLYIDVKKVVKIDNKTVKFIMERPYFKALEALSFWDIGIFPKHIYEFDDAMDFNHQVSEPFGSGPYVFERWDVGSQIVFRRNENYWGEKPKLDKLVFRFIKNDVARVQALKSGEVDKMIPSQEQFADLMDDEEFNKDFECLRYWNPGVPFYYVGWNMRKVYFEDRRVRLAMTHLINRDAMIEELLEGLVEPVTGPFYIKGSHNDASIKAWPYSVEKAMQLLDEAGWVDSDGDGVRDKDGVRFSFKISYNNSSAFYERFAKMMKDDMAVAGIEVIADPIEWSILMTKLSDREFDAITLGWGGEIVEDPFSLWHSSQSENRGGNYAGFVDVEADELIEKIRQSLDDDERGSMFHRLHGILHREQPYTFLYARPTFRFLDKRFENANVHEMGLNILEWYVPKDKQKYK